MLFINCGVDLDHPKCIIILTRALVKDSKHNQWNMHMIPTWYNTQQMQNVVAWNTVPSSSPQSY